VVAADEVDAGADVVVVVIVGGKGVDGVAGAEVDVEFSSAT
jgi:hypothetical protein